MRHRGTQPGDMTMKKRIIITDWPTLESEYNLETLIMDTPPTGHVLALAQLSNRQYTIGALAARDGQMVVQKLGKRSYLVSARDFELHSGFGVAVPLTKGLRDWVLS